MNNINRRSFLKILGNSTVAIGLSSYLSPISLMANESNDSDDFKALVVIKMGGGNDGLSMFVPAQADTTSNIGYEKYKQARSEELRIKDNDMMANLRALRVGDENDNIQFLDLNTGENSSLYLPNGKSNANEIYTKGYYLHEDHFGKQIATNGLMPELANLLDQGKGAVIQNIGNCKNIYPKNKLVESLGGKPSRKPPFLSSHDEQTVLLETGQATNIYHPTGWLGRLADKWAYTDDDAKYGLNISMSEFGNKKMMQGVRTSSFNMSFNGPAGFKNLDKDKYEEVLSPERRDIFKKLFKNSRNESLSKLDSMLKDWADAITKDPSKDSNDFIGLHDSYGNDIFGNIDETQHDLPDGIDNEVVKNFSAAARLISIAKRNNDKRVVISINLGGFDTHSGQADAHLKSYRGLSIGIDKFTRAMEKLGYSDKVTLFSVSEFGRTTVSNGNGTDHGWGSSAFVLGGAVKAGNVGTFPDLTPQSDSDISKKGRLIPTTSMVQYYATLLKWFGADNETLDYVLPDLKDFTDKDLGFMTKS